jgi:hypothetical protein
MNGSVVSQEKVSANECASTFRALKRSLFSVCEVEVSRLNTFALPLSLPFDGCPTQQQNFDLRDRSCRLLCSLRLNARLQN